MRVSAKRIAIRAVPSKHDAACIGVKTVECNPRPLIVRHGLTLRLASSWPVRDCPAPVAPLVGVETSISNAEPSRCCQIPGRYDERTVPAVPVKLSASSVIGVVVAVATGSCRIVPPSHGPDVVAGAAPHAGEPVRVPLETGDHALPSQCRIVPP